MVEDLSPRSTSLSSSRKLTFSAGLDDLCVRFIINLPEEDLSSVARICFQIEEAQWFYEDFIRPLDPALPSMTLRNFSLRIFQHCPLLAPFSLENHTRAFEEFLQYKIRVPVRGAILLNEDMDSTILVKGWKKGANWSFPRGKINKDEDDLECAIREVYEETGYDLHAAGLVPQDRNVKFIEITMREQQMRLYVFRDVPMETHFAPRTRKEISKIQWYKLSELPAFRKKGNAQQNDAAAAANANKFYMVAPFLVPLKKWVVQQKKRDSGRSAPELQFQSQNLQDEPLTEDDAWARSAPAVPDQRHAGTGAQLPALDTLEGATLELQRLLRVQPAMHVPQASPITEADGNKGLSLLAILQASNKGFATAPSSGPDPRFSHTSQDHLITQAQQPARPHHQHHPQPRLPTDTYQAPPGYSLAQPQTQPASWAPYNIPHAGGSSQYPSAAVTTPSHLMSQSNLRHPQPLTPQVPLAATNFLNSSSAHDQGGSMRQAVSHLPHNASMPANMNASDQPKPKQLTTHSLALLDVLKSSNKAPELAQTEGPTTYNTQPGPAQPARADPFANAQLPQQGMPGGWQQTLPVHAGAATAGTDASSSRSKSITEHQRSTLLQMFNKKTQGSSPLASGGQGSEVTTTAQSVTTRSIVTQPELPDDAARSGHHPPSHHVPGLQAQEQSSSAHHAYQDLGLTPKPQPQMQPRHILQRGESIVKPPPTTTASTRPAPPSLALAGHHEASEQSKPSSLASPPATSSFPPPSNMHRKSSTSHEQRQKLLSLFGKPQSTSPAAFATAVMDERATPAKAAGSPHLQQLQQSPSSQARSGTPGAAFSESRRGSSTPISPADRSFLLSYLASATGSSK